MDNEMIDRLVPILMKHNPQTKIGAAIVLAELFQAMREPTKKMMSIDAPDMPAGGDIKEIWQAMIDAVIND